MIVKTSKGTEFECESITMLPVPARLYLHLVNTSVEYAEKVFSDEVPIEGYPFFNAVQAISSEGGSAVKVSLRGA